MFLKKEMRPSMAGASTVTAIVSVQKQRDTTDISYANQTGQCPSFGSISPVCAKIWHL